MSEVPLSYFRATAGPAFEAVSAHLEAGRIAMAEISALAKAYGATEEYYHEGPRLLGLRFPHGVKPHGWRHVGRRKMNYLAPSDSRPADRKRMLAVVLPTGEDLAEAMGLPLFFDFAGHGSYCTAASGFMVGGMAFGTFPRVLKGAVKGIDLIMRHVYYQALDAFEGYQP